MIPFNKEKQQKTAHCSILHLFQTLIVAYSEYVEKNLTRPGKQIKRIHSNSVEG